MRPPSNHIFEVAAGLDPASSLSELSRYTPAWAAVKRRGPASRTVTVNLGLRIPVLLQPKMGSPMYAHAPARQTCAGFPILLRHGTLRGRPDLRAAWSYCTDA